MRRVVAAGVVAMLMLVAAPASAHGDERLIDGEFMVGPGETRSFEGELHYHRLVVGLAANGPISVRLADETTGAVVFETPADTVVRVNRLIRCCDGAAWAPHRLDVSNESDESVTVAGKATLVHDDVAVSVFRAEGGVIEGLAALGAVWIWALARTRRRASSSPRSAVATFAVLATTTLVVAAIGSMRYGGRLAGGLLAAGADLPLFPMNRIVSRASVVAFLAMAGWAVAGARWAGARPHMSPTPWMLLGLAMAAAATAAGAVVTVEYVSAGVATFVSTLAVVPIVAVLFGSTRDRTTAPEHSNQPQTV